MHMREKIESEEWPHGTEIPSQNYFAKLFGFSTMTVRDAVGVLVAEGMIHKQQGRHSRVNWPNPVHRLSINARPTARLGPKTRLIEFADGAEAGPVTREWSEGDVEVPKWVARWLELEAGATMLRRRQKLFVEGAPILMSTSYLPAGLTGGEGWREVEVGQLALTGHAMATTFVEERTRTSIGEECEELDLPRGVPVLLVCRPYQVPASEAGSPVRAGVLIVARGDYVYTRHAGVDGSD